MIDRLVVLNGWVESFNVMLVVEGGNVVVVVVIFGLEVEENLFEEGGGELLCIVFGCVDCLWVGFDMCFGNWCFWIGFGVGMGMVYVINGVFELCV